RFWRCNLKRADWLGTRAYDRAFAAFDLAENLLAEFQIRPTFVGQVQGAGRAIKKAHAQPRLQAADVPRQQRPRQPQLISGDGKASRANNPNKALHGAKSVHAFTIVYYPATMWFAFIGLFAQMSKS